MKKEKQIGFRISVPAFFALELEDVHRHVEGPQRAMSFPGFVGFLTGLGLEQYRKAYAPVTPEPETESEPEAEGEDWEFPKRRAGRVLSM
jgi:hypothetical protein